MIIDAATLDHYFATCAAGIGRSTIAAIVRVESAANPWAINDNTNRLSRQPGSYGEAVNTANALIARGHLIDMGLGQINSRNLGMLRMNVNQIFEPCRNIAAASFILKSCYLPARNKFGEGQKALIHALSCYNTGSLYAGKHYVDKILAAAGANQALRALAAGALPRRERSSSSSMSRATLLVNFSSEDWRMF